MENEYDFTLVQAAKSKGGDKYVCDTMPEFNVYVPQTISRKGSNEPIKTLKIKITGSFI